MEERKIKDFTDLHAWKRGHELVLLVYRFTKAFPTEERYGLTSQLRRAVVSITSNIAEGFGRSSWNEKAQFYSIAAGSLTEVQNQLIVARDVGHLPSDDFDLAFSLSKEVHKVVNALLSSTRSR
ncbi:four helix bundle protein [Candidatus Uhrbacteria bacterium]|nr:MAG: four helix bundle protein [Candidatus Uhrbacteria bacterium]